MADDMLERLKPCKTHRVVNCLACHKFTVRDYHKEVIEAMIERDRAKGHTVFVKWTCEHCELRTPHDKPFVFPKKYVCKGCGKESHPKGFGTLVVYVKGP